MIWNRIRAGLIIALLFSTTQGLFAQFFFESMEYHAPNYGISLSQYKERRSAVANSLGEGTALFVLSSDFYSNLKNQFTADLFSNELFYLTGINNQKCVLVLLSKPITFDNITTNEILFTDTQSTSEVQWYGKKASPNDAMKHLGIKLALHFQYFDSLMHLLMQGKDTALISSYSKVNPYYSMNESDTHYDNYIAAYIKAIFPKVFVWNHSKILNHWKERKSLQELQQIRKAVQISCAGHLAMMKFAREGATENELKAKFINTTTAMGADEQAYPPLVNCGKNTVYIHYNPAKDTLKNGGLVVADCGVMVNGYCSDITRTYPVSGEFTPEQKILYNIVLQAQDSAIAICRSGTPFSHIKSIVKNTLSAKLKEQGIITADSLISLYLPHGVAHHLGLDLHEESASEYLQEGNMLAIEPGLYIPEGSPCDKKWWNIGIRIEDNILVTNSTPEVLSKSLPKTLEDIEEIMKRAK